MKKKAYMAPATHITFTHLQPILATSGKVTLGVETNTGITQATDEENETPPGEADARINKWDDEDEYDE
jgi:hypothetical protein